MLQVTKRSRAEKSNLRLDRGLEWLFVRVVFEPCFAEVSGLLHVLGFRNVSCILGDQLRRELVQLSLERDTMARDVK